MAPLFQSEIDELMNNRIVANSSASPFISKNCNLKQNPSLLLSESARKLASEPLFAHKSTQKNSIFDIIPLNQNNPFVQSQSKSHIHDDQLTEKAQLMTSQRFLKFSSYYRDEYNQHDHEGEYEEVEIGGEIYRFKKKKSNSSRKRKKYRPLPPAPKRSHVSRQVNELAFNSSNFQQPSTFNDNESSFGGESLTQSLNCAKTNVHSDFESETATQKRKPNRGVIYDKYCLNSQDPAESDKYYNRIISFPKPKEPLPPYLKRIKDQLKKKYKQVFEDQDGSSKSSSESEDEFNEETRQKRRREKQIKSQQKLRKQQEKDVCEIVGENKISDNHRWGTKQDFQRYMKKKEYDQKLKKMNEERMRKLMITKRVNSKVEQNKEKHNFLKALLSEQSNGKISDEKRKNVVNIDSDENQEIEIKTVVKNVPREIKIIQKASESKSINSPGQLLRQKFIGVDQNDDKNDLEDECIIVDGTDQVIINHLKQDRGKRNQRL